MITTSTGSIYGSSFGKMQQEISRFILEENYRKEMENASDTQKYRAHKEKMNAALKNYVNMEINRMLAQEKPKTIYMAKLPRNPRMMMKGSGDTYLLRMWKKGFEENKKVNGAKNALNRGKTGKQINKKWSSDTSGR